MPALEPLYQLLSCDMSEFSKNEISAIEISLLIEICDELKNIYIDDNFYNLVTHREDDMLEMKFIKFIINDILLSGYYSIQGIAYYTGIDEDLIIDIVSDRYAINSIDFIRKIIEIHKSIRIDFYRKIAKKISMKYITEI